ncbi:hypothetical protein ACO0LC_10505 [Undibacterium sp. JH2W]|uniref:hypothetical protein n=1 Tax=Undibacterium sp. JH2W TaxID=3413037 RepID=UPI003BF05664
MSLFFSWRELTLFSNASGWTHYRAIFSPLPGVLLLVLGLRMIHLRKRLGDLALHIQPPLHAGCRDVSATLHFMDGQWKNMNTAATDYAIHLEVECIHKMGSGEDAKSTTLWWRELTERRLAHAASDMKFTLSLPADLPGSGTLEDKDSEIFWHLRVKVLGTKIIFILPVLAGQMRILSSDELLVMRTRRHYATPESAARAAAKSEIWFVKYSACLALAAIVLLGLFVLP